MKVCLMSYRRERMTQISMESFEIELFHVDGLPCMKATVYGMSDDYSDCTVDVVDAEPELELQRLRATTAMVADKRNTYALKISTFFEDITTFVFPKWIYHTSRLSTFLLHCPHPPNVDTIIMDARAWRRSLVAFCTSRCGRRLMGGGALYPIATMMAELDVGETMVHIRSSFPVPNNIIFGLQASRHVCQSMRKPFQLGERSIPPFYVYREHVTWY